MNEDQGKQPIAIGLDMGTGGARAVALDLEGHVVARGRSDLPADAVRVDGPIVEQDWKAWIETTISALGQLARQLPGESHVVGISLDATSGTFLLVDGLDEGPPTGVQNHARPSGRPERREIQSVYESQICEQAALLSADGSPALRVVVDTMAGAFTRIAPPILRSTGHDVLSLCRDIDPDFAGREPNPAVDANLGPLVEAVGCQGADLGIAFDGDGDRVIFVDHRGQIVRPEQLGALLIDRCFDHPTVVYDLKCASVLPRAVEAAGGTAVMQPSGHGFIKTTMIQRQADLGVEVSGHHFYGALGGGDDGLLTALVVLNLLTHTRQTLADLIEPIGWPAITPDLRIPYAGHAPAAVERIASDCGGRVSRLDGVRAEYDEGWALARASITEPAITFRFEGRDRNHLARIAARFLVALPELRTLILEKLND